MSEQEVKQATIKSIIGRMGVCNGYDELTRLELRELLEELEEI